MASRAEELLWALLRQASSLWEAEGFNRFNDGEVACTARLFDCCDRVIHSDDVTFPQVHVQYDGPQLTMSMRAGSGDPARTPRPDMTIRFGSAALRVEAKRLMLIDQLPRKYVREGMFRFLDGRYSSTPPHPGVMVGYILRDPPPAVVAAVNTVISTESGLGAQHLLGPATVTAGPLSRHRSSHAPGPEIVHFLLDIRSSPNSNATHDAT